MKKNWSFFRSYLFKFTNKSRLTNKKDVFNKSVTMLVPDDRIDRRVLLEARSLIKSGWSVNVIAAPPPFKGYCVDEECFPEVNIIRIDGNKAVSLPNELTFKNDPVLGRKWKEFYWYHNHFYIEAINHPADIYVAHDLPVLPAAAMAAQYSNSKLIYDAHELYPEQHHFGVEKTKMYSEAELQLTPFADEVITVNESIANEMVRRYGINIPKIILNCPEMNVNEFPNNKSNILKNRLNIDENKKILLFQGSLSLNRNLENLVEAMKLVKNENIVLVVLGPGDEKRNELIEIACASHILNEKVFFHNAVSQTALLQYTASADVGIIPYPHIDLNSYYCTPNKLFEFIVSGIPILGNDSPELRRFISEQGIGMNMPMGCSDEIAKAIDEFFRHDLLDFQNKVMNIRNNFIWDIQGRKIVQIYDDIIKRKIVKNAPGDKDTDYINSMIKKR